MVNFSLMFQHEILFQTVVVRKNEIRSNRDTAMLTLQSSEVGIHDEGRRVLASPQCGGRPERNAG
jgi:hypothetical protein